QARQEATGATGRPAAEGVPTGALPAELGRFHLLRVLGTGGFGIVYLADDPRLGRQVALKILRWEALVSAELRRRFIREGRAAARLQHPPIVPVFDSGEIGSLCYLVSAYCPGGTLENWLRQQQQPMPTRVGAEFLACLADAVQHAHAHGILHRDMKPA